MPLRSKVKGILFLLCLLFRNWAGKGRTLMFDMGISSDNTFLLIPLFFILWPWHWSFDYFLKTCTFTNYGEQGVLELRYSCDKVFSWVPKIFYIVTLILSSAYFLKTLTLLISFEQWFLELWYFTRVFLVTTSFDGYQLFLSCELDFRSKLTFWKL